MARSDAAVFFWHCSVLCAHLKDKGQETRKSFDCSLLQLISAKRVLTKGQEHPLVPGDFVCAVDLNAQLIVEGIKKPSE